MSFSLFLLNSERNLANLIKEDGATIGLLEASFALSDSPRKCTLLVPKQFALNQGFR